MSSDRSPHNPSDEGAVLVLVLVFVVVVGMLAVAFQQQATAGLTSTRTTTQHESRVSAVNAGVDVAMTWLRGDGDRCASGSATPPAATVNSFTATVSCTAQGTAPWAVFITDSSASGYIRTVGEIDDDDEGGGGGAAFVGPRVFGPVLNNGTWPQAWTVGDGLRVLNGDVTQRRTPSCSGGTTAPSGLDIEGTRATGDYSFRCTTSTTATPTQWPALTALFGGPQPSNATAATNSGSGSTSCRTFAPGRYASAPSLHNRGVNYFQNGVYYLDNVGTWTITTNNWVVGGDPGLGEVRRTSTPSCATSGPSTSGSVSISSGVVFVLGGDSRIAVTGAGRVELFSPRLAASPAVAGTSIAAVPSGLAGAWSGEQSNLATTTPILSVADTTARTCADPNADTANNAQVVVHGQVYVPDRCVLLGVRGNSSLIELRNGLVVGRLHIQSQEDNGGAGVLVAGQRTVSLTSTSASTANQKALTATVVATVANDDAHTVAIASWAMTNQ